MIVFWCLTVALWFALGFASGMLPLSDGAIRSPAEALLKFTRFAPCFLPGIIAYQLWRRPRELPGFLLPVFLLLCCGVFVLIPSNEPIEAGWFICLGVGVGVCFFREAPDGRLARFAQTIAQYSYGIYLLHYLAIWIGFVAFRTLNIAWQALIFIATLVTLPVILYHTVEAPMILQGVKIANRVTRTPSPEDAEGFSRKQTAQPLLVKGGLP
jgi:peptidoglycan/LPS O-acetylase OafA/YrhL